MPQDSFDDAMDVERRIHATLVPSQRGLLRVLQDVIGPDHLYTVEMRHNVYRIRANKEFDLNHLILQVGGTDQRGTISRKGKIRSY
ncbi:hypothetical protein MMYC01_200296 [Madurella mycetomatis]|uniref:Uncharacterized protein n=1 Tax=Madurella mycetomatis TaxID=100816 RepID=A0A175WKC5_9PEZI|nr:hypothetical protein MMYC01_200296 [Madurella mycetomatis]